MYSITRGCCVAERLHCHGAHYFQLASKSIPSNSLSDRIVLLPGGHGDESRVCMPASNLLKLHAAQMEVLICNMRCPGGFLLARLTRINVRD